MISNRPAPRVNLLLNLERALYELPVKTATNQAYTWIIWCYKPGMIGCDDVPTWGQNEGFKKNSSYHISSSSDLFFLLLYFFISFILSKCAGMKNHCLKRMILFIELFTNDKRFCFWTFIRATELSNETFHWIIYIPPDESLKTETFNVGK